MQALPINERVLDLDRLLAYIAAEPASGQERRQHQGGPAESVLQHTTTAILIDLDGETVWSPIKDVDLKFVVNTNWDLFEHTPNKTFYLRNDHSWLKARQSRARGRRDRNCRRVFLSCRADENWTDVKAACPARNSRRRAPGLCQHGPGRIDCCPGARRLSPGRRRAEASVGEQHRQRYFRIGKDGDFYYVITGRWFKAPSLDGPWTFATPRCPRTSRNPPRTSAVARARGGARHARRTRPSCWRAFRRRRR